MTHHASNPISTIPTTSLNNHQKHNSTSSLVADLKRILQALHKLGSEQPRFLLFMSQLIDPSFPSDQHLGLIVKVFEVVPTVLEYMGSDLEKLSVTSVQDENIFKHFLKLSEISRCITQLTTLQLLHLANNKPMTMNSPAAFHEVCLNRLKDIFNTWNDHLLITLHDMLTSTHLHLERATLLTKCPHVNPCITNLVIELLKLPIEEVILFKQTISKLDSMRDIPILSQILSLDSMYLIEIKRKYFSNLRNIVVEERNGGNQQNVKEIEAQKGMIVSYGKEIAVVNSHSIEHRRFGLEFVHQPPSQTVYQRILRNPFPTLKLLGLAPTENIQNMFVEASLIRDDNNLDVSGSLDGTRKARISNDMYAVFKRLKILVTSQQVGTHYRLRFTLQRYKDNKFYDIPEATITSNKIQVFSHTLYLPDRQSSKRKSISSSQENISTSNNTHVYGSNHSQSSKVKIEVIDNEQSEYDNGPRQKRNKIIDDRHHVIVREILDDETK